MRALLRDVRVGVSEMASGEPFSVRERGVAERVAERLVGGLRMWEGTNEDRVAMLANKLIALQKADAATRAVAPRKRARGQAS